MLVLFGIKKNAPLSGVQRNGLVGQAGTPPLPMEIG